MLEKNMINLRN